ncbi:hypothetical protein [Streptomyces sp. NPDC000410]|uniref:hypothetical protein n=1 Tax=Streptomyces sp. NPDC000410 TaxID=3154254 RepID=UPI0033300548
MKRARPRPRSWNERELRLIDRLAVVHHKLDSANRERAALIAYISRLHAGRMTPPDPAGGVAVHVDTAAGQLSWRVDAEDTHLLAEPDSSVETLTRLSFLHLHRRPNRPAWRSG